MTTGDNVAGSNFSIIAIVNISEIIGIQSLKLTWVHSNGTIIEAAEIGQPEFNLSQPVVSKLDLVFTNLLLSQTGVL